MLGVAAEVEARALLAAAGYAIIATNVRTSQWELDVVAWQDEVLVFVEVRSTRSLEFGGPFATITADKRRRLIRGANAFIERHEADWRQLPAVRFDVLGLWFDEQGARCHELICGAFESPR